MNLNHLIIIGNGFDLNLGLKTDYKSFIKNSFVFDNLETFKESDSYKLFNYLKGIDLDKKWVDIELELVNISQTKLEIPFNRNIYEELVNTLVEYLSQIDLKSSKKDTNAYHFLEYISNFEQDNFSVINFNYTNSFKSLVSDFGTNFYRRIQENHIHGNIDNRKFVVFGVHDEANIQEHHSFLYKSNPFSNPPSTNLQNILRSISTIHIFGHSLGRTDHSKLFPIFDYVFEQKRRFTIYLYHFGIESIDNLTNELMVLTRRRLTSFNELVNFHSIDTSNPIDFSDSKFSNF